METRLLIHKQDLLQSLTKESLLFLQLHILYIYFLKVSHDRTLFGAHYRQPQDSTTMSSYCL